MSRYLSRYMTTLSRHNSFLADVVAHSIHKEDGNLIRALVVFEQTVDHVRCVVGANRSGLDVGMVSEYLRIIEGRRLDMELEFVTMIRYRSVSAAFMIQAIETATESMKWYLS